VKIKSGFKQRIAVGVVCVIVVFYSIYHVTSIFAEDISTYAAGVTTESTVLNYNGYVFRDEQVLSTEKNGAVDYRVADGTKVSEGQTVAVAYSKGKNQQFRIKNIDNYIRILERSAEQSGNADIVSEKKNSSDTYDAIIKLLSAGDTGGLEYNAEKLLVELNNIDTISGRSDASVEEALKVLYEEREKIFSGSGDSEECTVEKNGYFFSEVDGCEEYFTTSALSELDHNSFSELTQLAERIKADDGDYGKITASSEWSIVLSVSKEDKEYFTEGSTYGALFSENNKTEIPLFLEKIIEAAGEETVLLVFNCDRQPDNFSFNRCQGVSITVSTVSGLYVPKNVVERVNSEKGVYILRGSIVYFRHIRIVYEGSDYYLVEADTEHDEERTYLRPNDMIILNGKNLFDGRVLD